MAEEVLKNVLEWCFNNTNILNAKDNANNGERFIHIAAENGYVTVIKHLLEKGVSPDLKEDSNGNSPLHIASEYGHVEVAKLLLQNGADPNSVNGDKEPPICTATEEGHADIINLLIQNGANAQFPRKWS